MTTTFKMPDMPMGVPTHFGGRVFTSGQVEFFGKQCAVFALMQAAQKCEEIYESRGDADECATEIRAMIGEIK